MTEKTHLQQYRTESKSRACALQRCFLPTPARARGVLSFHMLSCIRPLTAPCCARLVAAALAVDAVVGQVDKTVAKTLSVVHVGLRRQPAKPLLVHVHPAYNGHRSKKQA